MNDPKIQNTAQQPEPEKDTSQRPYELPAIVYRAPLEATAGVCSTRPPGKTNTPQDPCTTAVS